MRARLGAALVAALFSTAACSGPTSILVRITSSLTVPDQLDELHVHVEGDSPSAAIDRDYVITGLPQTLSLRPGPMSMSRVTITVTGTHGPTFVVQRVVGAMFVTGTEQVVEIDLPADCVGVVCGAGIDCVAGRCSSRDGGVGDAGPGDAGLDAATVDVGPPDAGCASDLACDDHLACTHDACVTGACTHTPDDALCMTGTTCDVTTGCPPRSCTADADCDDHLFCNGVETCVSMACAAASSGACDDSDNCTTDTCDEAADTCAHATRDADMDGFGDVNCPAVGGVANTDCVDSDATISPDAIDACDGIDNDCSGTCDSLNTCCRGAVGPCQTTCDTPGTMSGTRVCTGTCSWSACSPPAETCNGRDDDCNGACDDGAGVCCAGATTPCMTSCRSMGTQVCAADCSFTGSVCTPPAETCNGTDDDCDSIVDEGFTCAVGTTRACTTSCTSTGLQTCDVTCGWGACVPPTEVCNGVDDNCVGGIDEGCGACSSCPGATTVTGTGGRYDVTLGASSTTSGTCGGAGPEATLTFTTTAVSDVLIATHGATQNTVVYVRSCTCTGSEIGCNDDADGRTSSVLRLTALAAGTYDVIVDSAAGASGSVPVDIYISPTTAMPSDTCGNAQPIAPGATTLMGSTTGYGNDYDLAISSTGCPYSGGGDAEDRVYYFYLPTARTVSFNGCNTTSNYDQAIYIRSVCNDATLAMQPACNDDGCTGSRNGCGPALRSSTSVALSAGLYYLVVDGYGGTCQSGTYQFSVSGI